MWKKPLTGKTRRVLPGVEGGQHRLGLFQGHPGLGQFVTGDDVKWEFGYEYSVESVGVADQLAKHGSPVYPRQNRAYRR